MDKKLNELVYILLTLEEQGLSNSLCTIRCYNEKSIFLFANEEIVAKLEDIFGGKFERGEKCGSLEGKSYYRMKCGEYFTIEAIL